MSTDGHIDWLGTVSPDELRRIVDALYRVHEFLAVITDLDTLLERIMEQSKLVANAEACSLMLYDGATEELYFRVALGEKGDQQALKREVRLRLNEGIAGLAATTRKPVNVPDAQQHPRFYRLADQKTHFETRSLLAVPLFEKDELVGVLEVVNKRGDSPFTDADQHIMTMFASLAATAILNARLIEENIRAERMAAIGEAVAGLSHHTKNIITGMTSSVDLIEDGLNQNDLEVLRRSWPVFRRSSRRIANFVEDMLAFSKPREPLRERCDLTTVLDDAWQTFQILLARKNVSVVRDTSGVTSPVHVDPQGIYRCVLNLLSNAADAVPYEKGAVRITAQTTADGAAHIEIADNGPGVPEDKATSIFEPFFSTKGAAGTGLGLAVARKIVLEHGGDISVDRSAEGGALFRVVLPASGPSTL